MTGRQLLLLHGYSDSARSFSESWIPILTGAWKQPGSSLSARHAEWAKTSDVAEVYDPADIFPVTYESLVNEVSIDDIAKGLNELLRAEKRFDPNRDFDVIVHSTGMLVFRAWLTRYTEFLPRVKHVVGLAPASFGSPLAHKGRSWLARAFKGNEELGPDFLSTGDLVLDALELGSPFTWDLAHRDLFGPQPFYRGGADNPFLFTLCGQRGYDGIERIVNEPGTDGTVRRAGVSLNSLKLRAVVSGEGTSHLSVAAAGARTAPAWLTTADNHSTILASPSVEAIGATLRALAVDSTDSYAQWAREAWSIVESMGADRHWQQFVVRAFDDRGKSVDDFDVHIEIEDDAGKTIALTDGSNLSVHNYAADSSLRCFHLNHSQLREIRARTGREPKIRIELTARTGTRFVEFRDPSPVVLDEGTCAHEGTSLPLFYPFTTTLLEVVFERRPTSVGTPSSLTRFDFSGTTTRAGGGA